MKKLLMTVGTLVFMALGSAHAAGTGSYMGAAETLSPGSSEQTKEVTLVASYDPEDKTYDYDWGVYYVKVKVSKGKTFSIWADNKSDEFMMLGEDYDPEDEKLLASCDSYSRSDAELYVLTPECWDEDDPSSGTFYFYVDGDVGTTCTLHYTSEAIDGEAWEGEEPPPPLGTAENPEKIDITEEWKPHTGTCIEGEYYYYFNAEANRAYRIRGVSGTEKSPLSLSEGIDSEAETDWVADPSVAADPSNDAYEIRAMTAGRVVVVVDGDWSGKFEIKAIKLKARTIDLHESVGLNAGNGFKTTFAPGRLSAKEDTWDNIIDEHLCRIELAAGERCIFQTTGADTNLLMRVYDAKGNALEENFGALGFDPYIGFSATAKGTYYVGVCQDGVEFCDAPTAATVELSATKVGPPVENEPDEWDAEDDTLDGATEVEAEISNDEGHPVTGEGHGDHQLSLTDWSDCFVVKVQRGITYKFVAESAVETDYSLLGEVYFTETGKTTSDLKTSGTISGDNYILYTPTKNGECRIRVSVREGKGRVFPAYRFHVVAYVAGQKLGYMTVNIKGATSATWTYKNSLYPDTTKRVSGEKVLTWGSNTITFSKVTGFTTPAAETYVMTGDEAKDVVWGVYNDTSDPDDDYTSGTNPGTKKKYAPVKISPSAKGVSVLRSLFKGDCADWFSFSGAAGVYYKFTLTGKTADAIVRVYDPSDLENPLPNVLNENPDAWQVLIEEKGTYYVCVTHADEDPSKWEDDGYTMTATSVNVGTIKLAKTEISVKDNVAYAELTVNRSSGDGMVRVKWATEDDTAKDRSEYYADSGELVWENGDKKAQKISVRLLPEETATFWKPDSQFKVNLSLYPEDEIDTLAGEYIPALLTPTATVTVKSSGKKTPGTVSVTGCTNDATEDPLTVEGKSPSVNVSDGCGSLTFALSRLDGCNGDVAVRVQTQKGTLKDGEFASVDQTFVWEDGIATNQYVTVEVDPLGDPAVVTKNFKLKLTVVKKGDNGEKYDSAKIGTATVTVNLRNNLVEETAEELAKTLDKSEGLVLKAGKAGTWYVDSQDGALKTVPLAAGKKAELTFTLTGPGLFKAKASKTCGTFTCKIGKEADIVIDEATEIVRLVPAGSTAVKFSMTGETSICGSSVGSLAAEFDGQPYFWMPLTGVAADLPKDKATVLPAAERQAFGWTVPAKAAESGIYYRLTLAEKAKDLGTGAAKILTTGLTESEYTYVGALDANKTYCWRVDYSLDSENWIAPKTSWTFKTAAGTEGIPMPAVAEGATDSYGRDIVAGKTIGLMQGVKVNFALTASNTEAVVTYSLANGKLPDGVKLVADKKSGVTSITGVPTKAGEFNVIIQAKAGKTAGTTEAFSFNVKPLALCAGTFNGVLKHDSESADVVGMGELSSVAFTASEKGALSAKVQIAGKSYTFKATGYDRVEKDEEWDDETLYVKLTQVQKIGKASYTNTLDLALWYDELDEEGKAMLGSAAEATLAMDALSTDKAYAGERVWDGVLCRDNTKLAAMVADEADFVGYYTLALCPPKGTDPKVAPAGNGYLTLTVDNKGKVKVAGKLADGTSLSGSVVATLFWVGSGVCDPGHAVLRVPYYFVKSTSLFGGTIFLTQTADGIVVDSESEMIWNNDAETATYGGIEGFKLSISAVGGYYDTILNLQRYYLDNKFLLDVSDDLPSELFADGYGLATYGLPGEEKPLEMLLAGNTPTVDKCALAKIGTTKLYDLGESVNPWNVKLTFKRATGILSGSLSAWSETEDGLAQKEIKSLKHEGVLLLNRGASPLADNVWTAGYYLAPTTLKKVTGSGTRKWNCSLPFNITFEPPVE